MDCNNFIWKVFLTPFKEDCKMVCWNDILSNKTNKSAVVHFVEGKLSLKNVKKRVDADAWREFGKITVRGSDDCRRLARKALRRRAIRYTVTG